jgi:hypothetical protein
MQLRCQLTWDVCFLFSPFLILIPDRLLFASPFLVVLRSPSWDNQSSLTGLRHQWYQGVGARLLNGRSGLHSLRLAFDESAAYVNSKSRIH